MDDASIDMLAPERLARLLDVEVATTWSEADAAAALAHQLASPLLPDLALCPGLEGDRLRGLAQGHATLLGALTAPVPELELLQAIKQWARHLRGDAASPLAGSPATALYFGALAAAQWRLGQSITTLTAAQLREGYAWGAAYPAAGPLAELFAGALAALPPFA